MSLSEFYQMFAHNRPDVIIPNTIENSQTGHFNVLKRSGSCALNPSPYNRRQFYLISLIVGKGVLYYPNRRIEIDQPSLLFTNTTIPYSWESTSALQSGYICLFTESFVRQRNPPFGESFLAQVKDNPVYPLLNCQVESIGFLFEQMIAEMASDYVYRYDVIRNYVNLLVHQAMKMNPLDTQQKPTNASTRIASLFFELLEKQFPILHKDHVLQLRTAHDFAAKLSIHVNYLNHAVKVVTGKTTSEHISGRITTEAITLLQQTGWNIAEIGYCLGFEYPANFNQFFKRQTMAVPGSFRDKNSAPRRSFELWSGN